MKGRTEALPCPGQAQARPAGRPRLGKHGAGRTPEPRGLPAATGRCRRQSCPGPRPFRCPWPSGLQGAPPGWGFRQTSRAPTHFGGAASSKGWPAGHRTERSATVAGQLLKKTHACVFRAAPASAPRSRRVLAGVAVPPSWRQLAAPAAREPSPARTCDHRHKASDQRDGHFNKHARRHKNLQEREPGGEVGWVDGLEPGAAVCLWGRGARATSRHPGGHAPRQAQPTACQSQAGRAGKHGARSGGGQARPSTVARGAAARQRSENAGVRCAAACRRPMRWPGVSAHLLLRHDQLQVGQGDASELLQHNVTLQSAGEQGVGAAAAQAVEVQSAGACTRACTYCTGPTGYQRGRCAGRGAALCCAALRSAAQCGQAQRLACMNFGSASFTTSTSEAGTCGAGSTHVTPLKLAQARPCPRGRLPAGRGGVVPRS